MGAGSRRGRVPGEGGDEGGGGRRAPGGGPTVGAVCRHRHRRVHCRAFSGAVPCHRRPCCVGQRCGHGRGLRDWHGGAAGAP
jgi:hypothetical protein